MEEIVEPLRSVANYLWMASVGLLGGLANYIAKLKENKLKAFSFVELLGELVISGFVALITAFVCIDLGLSTLMTYAACGIGGHLGTRGLYIIEQRALEWLESKRVP